MPLPPRSRALPLACCALGHLPCPLRNTIEGPSGYAKDTAHHALGQPARRRVRGIAACSPFTAPLLMAANIRKIRAWRAQATKLKTASRTPRARRRRASLRDYLPDG